MEKEYGPNDNSVLYVESLQGKIKELELEQVVHIELIGEGFAVEIKELEKKLAEANNLRIELQGKYSDEISKRNELENKLLMELDAKNYLFREIYIRDSKLCLAVEALSKAYELIRSTGYTIENNKRVMDGNEYVWIDRGIVVIKEALAAIKEGGV